ncbi:MAG TPA: hypothetical protein VF883_12200, partial [Thermoanaerobaculia bacterium]
MLFKQSMKRPAGVPIATLLALLMLSGCTGGSESKAASGETATATEEGQKNGTPVDAAKQIATIDPAIPLYQG